MVTKEQVMEVLKQCMDPELGISLVDLGLIYDVKVEKDEVKINMTLTTVGCPLVGMMRGDVKEKVGAMKGVKEVEVEIVWDPPWTPERISAEGKKKLGFG